MSRFHEMYLSIPFLSNQMDDLAVAKVPINRVVVSLVLGYKTTHTHSYGFLSSFLNMLCIIHTHVDTMKKKSTSLSSYPLGEATNERIRFENKSQDKTLPG